MSRTHSYVIPASIWDEDSDYPVADWKYEIANDDTRLGYWEWVEWARHYAAERPWSISGVDGVVLAPTAAEALATAVERGLADSTATVTEA